MSELEFSLTNFKVHLCKKTQTPHDRKSCVYFHSHRDRRRIPECYKPEQCELQFDNSRICPFGDSCEKSHNRHELLYHSKMYKTRFCASYPHGECIRGRLCAFAHSRQEIRSPLFDEKDEFQPTQEFFMKYFKTLWCPFGNQHDWHTCLYAHTFQDCRRDPAAGYSSDPCKAWQKDSHSASYDRKCPNGVACPYSHGSKEQLYHPTFYITMPCSDYQKNGKCPRGQLCAFFHDIKEKRQVTMITQIELPLLPTKLLSQIRQHFLSPPLFNLDDFESFGSQKWNGSQTTRRERTERSVLSPEKQKTNSLLCPNHTNSAVRMQSAPTRSEISASFDASPKLPPGLTSPTSKHSKLSVDAPEFRPNDPISGTLSEQAYESDSYDSFASPEGLDPSLVSPEKLTSKDFETFGPNIMDPTLPIKSVVRFGSNLALWSRQKPREELSLPTEGLCSPISPQMVHLGFFEDGGSSRHSSPYQLFSPNTPGNESLLVESPIVPFTPKQKTRSSLGTTRAGSAAMSVRSVDTPCAFNGAFSAFFPSPSTSHRNSWKNGKVFVSNSIRHLSKFIKGLFLCLPRKIPAAVLCSQIPKKLREKIESTIESRNITFLSLDEFRKPELLTEKKILIVVAGNGVDSDIFSNALAETSNYLCEKEIKTFAFFKKTNYGVNKEEPASISSSPLDKTVEVWKLPKMGVSITKEYYDALTFYFPSSIFGRFVRKYFLKFVEEDWNSLLTTLITTIKSPQERTKSIVSKYIPKQLRKIARGHALEGNSTILGARKKNAIKKAVQKYTKTFQEYEWPIILQDFCGLVFHKNRLWHFDDEQSNIFWIDAMDVSAHPIFWHPIHITFFFAEVSTACSNDLSNKLGEALDSFDPTEFFSKPWTSCFSDVIDKVQSKLYSEMEQRLSYTGRIQMLPYKNTVSDFLLFVKDCCSCKVEGWQNQESFSCQIVDFSRDLVLAVFEIAKIYIPTTLYNRTHAAITTSFHN